VCLILFSSASFDSNNGTDLNRSALDINISNMMHSSQQEYATFSGASSVANAINYGSLLSKVPPVVDEFEQLYSSTLKVLDTRVRELYESQRALRRLEATTATATRM
jgi:hypothetical protein